VTMTPEEDREFRAAVTPGLSVVTLEEFAAVDEKGAGGLLGDEGDAPIAEDSDVLVYGDGGAGKTTLVNDLALHLGAGDPWLGIGVGRPLRVLIVELEGPRPLFRRKLRRKAAAWKGSPLDGRVRVLDDPWATFSFSDDSMRAQLATEINGQEIDVLIVGPLTRAGMDAAGTLQEVRDFMGLVGDLRKACARRLAIVIVHHESKSGAVSGAWEGAVDTLLRVEARGPGHTLLRFQKARWSSSWHGQNINLSWTDGEGFAVEGERDYVGEITALLADGQWRTAKEIAAKDDGIGAGVDTVRGRLKEHPAVFVESIGSAVGRSARATVYQLTSAQKSVRSVGDFPGTEGLLTQPPLTPVGGGGEVSSVPPMLDGPTSTLESVDA
jgi:AAA domain